MTPTETKLREAIEALLANMHVSPGGPKAMRGVWFRGGDAVAQVETIRAALAATTPPAPELTTTLDCKPCRDYGHTTKCIGCAEQPPASTETKGWTPSPDVPLVGVLKEGATEEDKRIAAIERLAFEMIRAEVGFGAAATFASRLRTAMNLPSASPVPAARAGDVAKAMRANIHARLECVREWWATSEHDLLWNDIERAVLTDEPVRGKRGRSVPTTEGA